MARGWTKLFASIVTSSVWMEDDKVVRVWVAMMALCDIEGVVEGSVPGFANLARVTVSEMEHAVEVLSTPDRHSRTPDNEGRRIEIIPGGWRVLNYPIYRDRGQDKEGSFAPYQRSYRQKRKEEREKEEREKEADVTCNREALRVKQKREDRGEKREEKREERKDILYNEVSGVSPSSSRKAKQASPKDPTAPDASQLISAFNEIAIPGSPWPRIDEEEAARRFPGLSQCLTVPGWAEDAKTLFALMPDHEISPFLAGKVKAKKPGDTPFNPEDAFTFLVADPTRVPGHLKRVLANHKKVQRTRKALAAPTTIPEDEQEAMEAQLSRIARLDAEALKETR